MAQLTIDNLLVAAKTAKFQKSLSLDLFSFSYFGSNEIWHQFFVTNILLYLKESIDKNTSPHVRKRSKAGTPPTHLWHHLHYAS